MEEPEREAVVTLKSHTDQEIARSSSENWSRRRNSAKRLIAEVYTTWWHIHINDSTAYERDVRRLNQLTGWNGDYAQESHWQSSRPDRILMPPKFFGGDPACLDEGFVASMSLNHAILDDPGFRDELLDQQYETDAFNAHAGYFERPYAYPRFF